MLKRRVRHFTRHCSLHPKPPSTSTPTSSERSAQTSRKTKDGQWDGAKRRRILKAIKYEYVDSQRAERQSTTDTLTEPAKQSRKSKLGTSTSRCTSKRPTAVFKASAMYLFSAANRLDSTSRMYAISSETHCLLVKGTLAIESLPATQLVHDAIPSPTPLKQHHNNMTSHSPNLHKTAYCREGIH